MSVSPISNSRAPESATPAVELRNVSVHYPSATGLVHALDSIDLSIPNGQIFGIIGKSGAGKSSLVRTINLLARPSTGKVLVAGRDMLALPDDQLRAARRDIGMVFQHFNLLESRTVFGNVAMPLELMGMPKADIRTRVGELLDLVGLGNFADRHPSQLSGGQRQRVGIARALASKPKVLLCDEATSALDPETARSILALLRQINADFGLTIILITHQMQVIKQLAHRAAVLDAGRVVELADVSEIFLQPREAITKSLVEDVVPQALPEPVAARVRAVIAQHPGEARLLRLAFLGEDAERSVLSELVRRFGVDANIVHGQVDEIQGLAFASLTVLLRGPADALALAIAHLQNAGVRTEEIAA
ncbi:methionine ABC transporter ATP-binding protein [Xylophilus sp. GOD-11R]|uniref:methionine ABC transporter ATP-binding protein n=1 Tax=Xylophilus sp. GOD-11R TaxID=3089814 RepID=UPI00298CA102|nr:methionine ABC transporter ATP-binding protein [Xylophilus sp. GOD-11R]WPB54947.1 methionine ABC transporter ATP-binding protein [Xylophilus sp. GOD-11R]